ncbi:MAG: sulfide/dihydroorotate dehydrogenase-like FAD/NAD-binding protein [Lachnospiraceae bacterium]|nr:sulfide/dihydroorotate dehydrogenase-like FAD/NAD-binding protein [Lachnospiraceae bacterium]
MYQILNAKWLNENIFLMDIEAKRVADRCQPGQFVIVRVDRDGERIPLTICDYDREKGSVTIVAQVVGAETYRLSKLKAGEYVQDFVGPLGKASEFVETPIEELKQKRILFIAGGVGAAPVYPQVKWLKERGVASDVILGARSKEILILEEELKAVAQNLYISTDDGSYGTKGTASVVLQNLYDAGQTYDVCVVIGPMIMMKYTCLLTKKLELPTVVSMNPIMVDGTGMCGACRLTVGGEVKFACVDGPEFDGHLVNFDEAMKRQTLYKTEEGRAFLRAKEGDTHHGGCGQCGGDRA